MLGLLLLQVLASCLWLGHSEVVNSFDSCAQFFYDGIPPVIDAPNTNNLARICQRFRNSYRYATLYNRDKRIPVYSAYKYEPGKEKTPPNWWMVEPQLVDRNSFPDMRYDSTLTDFTSGQINESQAVPADYNGEKDLDHGHLCPSAHQFSKDSMIATFTLTNAVPQYKKLNGGQWNIYEYRTMKNMAKGCTTTYVITGAVPGNTGISDNRVNRPSHIWSAACCLVDEKSRKAWGVIAENDKNEVKSHSLEELEEKLTKLYKGKVTLFNNACSQK
ncbi:endonuclease domain-containing 1 protein-like [Geothlypis trichas]